MRKLILALFIASIAAVGFAGTASASTVHRGSINCSWAPASPTCPTTQPGTPGGCTRTSFAGGGCVTDTLSFTSRTRGHDGTWNTDRNRGPHDPCVIHRPQGGVLQAQDRFRDQGDFRGCRCETVKIWHTKIVCNKEIWYYTLATVCRNHHRDPHQCGCQQGGQIAPAVRSAA